MSQKTKHVFFCTSGIFPIAVGGIQRHSRLLIEELAKTRLIKISVIHPHAGKIFDEDLQVEEFAIPFVHSKGNYLRNCYKYSKLVFNIVKQYPDAIIYSQGLSVWYGISELGNRVIYNPHGIEPFQGLTLRDRVTTFPFRIILRQIFKQATCVVSLGGKLTDILKNKAGVDPDKIVILPNAVNLPQDFKKNESQSTVNMLFVGRFAHNKGIDLLLETIKELNQTGYVDKLHFNFVGAGPLYDKLTSQYTDVNISYAGFATEALLRKMYINNDVFLFPTLFEGMPTVVLEAMSYAMPVIVSDVGATAELVDESNGILIEKANKIQLKNAIIKIASMTANERNKLAEASLAKVKQRFTWQQIAMQHINLFERIKTF